MQEITLRTHVLPLRDKLYRIALGIILHTAEAEDIVQETMIRAWNRRTEWTTINDMEAWVTQICKNLALDHKARAEARNKPLNEERDAPATRDSADKALNREDTLRILNGIINRLPPPQPDIVHLRDIEGLSYKDIAARLGITEDQVRVGLHRARQRIKEEYLRIDRYGL